MQILVLAMPDQIYFSEFKGNVEHRYKANRNNTDQLSDSTLITMCEKQQSNIVILIKTKSISSNANFNS